MKSKIIANNSTHLRSLIENEIRINGNECDLNHIDVSGIKTLDYIFAL